MTKKDVEDLLLLNCSNGVSLFRYFFTSINPVITFVLMSVIYISIKLVFKHIK